MNPESPARWAKDLLATAPHQRPYEIFRDFCELAYCAHAKLAAPNETTADALEARYMATVRRQPHPDTIQKLPGLMARAVLAVADGGTDFLGVAAGELGTLDPSHLGQAFTPYPLSRLIAEMQLGDAAALIEERGFITVCEPASGAGGMLIAAADVLTAQGHDPARVMLAHATDLSLLCYHMTYLSLTWRGIAAAVHHGNTLSLETFESAWTLPALLTFLPTHGTLDTRRPAAPLALPAAPAEPQLTLF